MAIISPGALSAKQLAKYNRQKTINLLEKITKNLFRMFRREDMSFELIVGRFFDLYSKLQELNHVNLYANYHREMRKYIESIALLLSRKDETLLDRPSQMSQLNRLQKLKNMSKYKKNKHSEDMT